MLPKNPHITVSLTLDLSLAEIKQIAKEMKENPALPPAIRELAQTVSLSYVIAAQRSYDTGPKEAAERAAKKALGPRRTETERSTTLELPEKATQEVRTFSGDKFDVPAEPEEPEIAVIDPNDLDGPEPEQEPDDPLYHDGRNFANDTQLAIYRYVQEAGPVGVTAVHNNVNGDYYKIKREFNALVKKRYLKGEKAVKGGRTRELYAVRPEQLKKDDEADKDEDWCV